ncbi:MAG: hypothetical protein J6A28_01375 [Clostridia bacterium]|nr:hypothetical protein [Clostridia bacterium]
MAKRNQRKNATTRDDIIQNSTIEDTATQSVASFAMRDDVETIVLADVEDKETKEKEPKIEKRKKPKKVYKKSTFKHKMKVIGCLAALGVFTGSGLGVWYFNTALKSNVDYASLNPSDYYGNVDDVFNDLQIIDKTNWVEEAKAKGLKPDDASLSAADNILLCEYNATQNRPWEIVGTGKVLSLGIAQTVYSEKKFDGDIYSFVSISAGMITVASCDVLDKNGNVTIYNGKDPHESGATWVDPSTISSDEFKEFSGVMPNAVSPYIISEKTIDTATEVVYDSESNLYSFTVTLKPVESVLLYYKQVRRSGGLEADPEFHSIEIKFNINENWDFVSTEITESYKAVKFGMPVTCDGTLLTTYSFDGEVTLPV